MNGWIDVATVVVVAIVGMILVVKELGWKKRYDQLHLHMDILQKENNTFKGQLKESGDSLLTCMEERDALQLKLDEALKPRTRVSRAKPPMNE